jgi:hypothetical protein
MKRRLAIAAAILLTSPECWSKPPQTPLTDAPERPWGNLPADEAFTAWRRGRRGWSVGAEAALDADNGRRLRGSSGAGVLISRGDSNLLSRDEFQDVELKLDFLIPRGSNSGVKLNGLYEIQIRDSHAAEKPTADDCGGVYPRASLGPPYRYLDEGVPPRVNAAKPAGEWQTLEIAFVSPQYDAGGKKTANACFLRVVLNGETIHEDVDLKWPTGAAWNQSPEVPRGPLLLQGDHGPVAFRNISVRPLALDKAAPRP